MGRLYFVGDFHGWEYGDDRKIFRFAKENPGLCKDDVVVQLGDFGYIWDQSAYPKEVRMLAKLAALPFTLCVVPGNHENYDRLDQLPQTIKFGNTVQLIETKSGPIYVLERGAVYNICDTKCLAFGGATSHDRNGRVEGRSWWARELPSQDERLRLLRELDQHQWAVDFVFTHTPPRSIVLQCADFYYDPWRKHSILNSNCQVSDFLDEIAERLQFDTWAFGHMHLDESFTDAKGRLYIGMYHSLPERARFHERITPRIPQFEQYLVRRCTTV